MVSTVDAFRAALYTSTVDVKENRHGHALYNKEEESKIEQQATRGKKKVLEKVPTRLTKPKVFLKKACKKAGLKIE